MVTQKDKDNNPQLDKMGVSVNQYFDFSNEPNPHQIPSNLKQQLSNEHYEITESSPVDYGAFLPKKKGTWHKSIDKIFLINLAKRKDRLESATKQLNQYGIPFERVEAIENERGAEGLRLTMLKLFKQCIKKKYKMVLVLEDDIDLIEPAINEVLDKMITDIPKDFDIIYMGGQICAPIVGRYSDTLLKVTHTYATHAAIYSLKAMKALVAGGLTAPIDNHIVQTIQAEGNCYHLFPILISQIISKSDIYSDQEQMDWQPYIQGKYWEKINECKLSGNFSIPKK